MNTTNTPEFNEPAIAIPPSPELPAPLPPTPLILPNWLLAILFLTVLVERLNQLLPIAIAFLEKVQDIGKQ
ncbi:MAG: hypothetical protein SW833_24290 [Cyanobacteriota bacterium]|nr:hypothetical protein [Cyanobacteriota bacterium]